jgi:diamine N-acetyltransferase
VSDSPARVHIEVVDADNWRAVARLRVLPEQERFVAATTYYLALCTYGGTWNPLAVKEDGEVIGFLMWGFDPDEDAAWLGGIVIDHRHQGRGLGRAATREAMRMLHDTRGYTRFALSYNPANATAKRAYAALGFAETGEMAEDELVARTTLT